MGMDFDVLSKGAEEGDSASATAQEKKPEAKKEEEKSRGEEPMDTGDGRERTPEGDQQKVLPLCYYLVLFRFTSQIAIVLLRRCNACVLY